MKSPAVDIKDFLLSASEESTSTLGLIFGSNLFVSLLPETTNIATAIMDAPGAGPQPNNIQQPTIKILTRGKAGEYEAAFEKIQSIIDTLHGIANTTINSTKYIQIYKFNEISHVGNDSKLRPIFSCTLAIKRA